jgi:Uma2 family endonuclease
MSTAAKPLTMQDLLNMPDDGVRRWIIDGELREEKMDTGEFNGQVMTIRNRFHSTTMANVAAVLNVWRWGLPEPRGAVVCGEAGVLLPNGPENAVGVDVAYVPPDVMIQQTEESTVIHGVPTLIVEILSPTTQIGQINERVRAFHRAGVPLVWVIDPDPRTVSIRRRGARTVVVNDEQELTGDPELPGFRIPVVRLFE